MINLELYDQLLATVVTPTPLAGEMCLFPTSIGGNWAGGLLICGRAPNGYDPRWTASDVNSPVLRSDLLARISSQHADSPNTMTWVTAAWGRRGSYNTARSQFWQATRGVVDELRVADTTQPTWPLSLAWTNLYRIAPASHGNPTAEMCERQQPVCKKLLAADLNILRPKYLLFMTGSEWVAPFVQELKLSWRPPSELVEAVGAAEFSAQVPTSIVVAKHPQGKPRAAFVRAVVDAFRSVC